MRISIILGTRPEIVKLSPIIRKCESLGIDYFILHTGQHYSYNMDGVFFEQLKLPKAKYNLNVGSGSHAEQTGKMLPKIERVLSKEKPDIVLAEGDTNTVLAAALVAAKLCITFGHVEAGLRSYDRKMPEEVNRVLADHCSDFLFAPTTEAERALSKEGLSRDKIFMTGNTIVDAVYQNLEISKRKVSVIDEIGIDNQSYFVATVHRQENVDDQKRFCGIVKGLQTVRKKYDLPMLYPIHPRAQKQLDVFNIKTEGLKLLDPMDYLSFLQLESDAKLILTDSGGIQEEACILQTPCVTLRYNTERLETLEVGSNVLAGTDPCKIAEKVDFMLNGKCGWKNPFGDGRSSERIIRILKDKFAPRKQAR